MLLLICHLLLLYLVSPTNGCCPGWQRKYGGQLKILTNSMSSKCRGELSYYRYQGGTCMNQGKSPVKWICQNLCRTQCGAPRGKKIGCAGVCHKNSVRCNCHHKLCSVTRSIDWFISHYKSSCVPPKPAPKPPKPPPPPKTEPATERTTTPERGNKLVEEGGRMKPQLQVNNIENVRYQPDPNVNEDIGNMQSDMQKVKEELDFVRDAEKELIGKLDKLQLE